jgi:arabinose-5-phosphate isomerase
MSSIARAREVLQIEADGILAVKALLNDDFDKAIDLILSCPTRLIITGIGKSGIIGQKIAATLNSTGTPSIFLHPVEAMHGDLGIVDPRDVVLALSYSGETTELNLLIPTLKNRGMKIIALTGKAESTLSSFADATLLASVPSEACPLGLAPTASTTAALAVGDALAVVLIDRKHFAPEDFRKNHPGGSLGERLKVSVSEVMLTGSALPTVGPSAKFAEIVTTMNSKSLGAVVVLEGDKLCGIITDGDLRRLLSDLDKMTESIASEIMTAAPKTIKPTLLAADALSLMQRYEVTILPITNGPELVGLLHLHDLLGKGEFRMMV